MIEVYPNLFVGGQDDLHKVWYKSGWYVVSAAKEPHHRAALGYTGRAASKDHPEYLVAKRDHHMILNLVDVDDPAYVSSELIDTATKEIHDELQFGANKVLIHCNQGGSRAPTLAMLYLAKYTDEFAGMDYEQAADYFRATYPAYAPARGMALFAAQNWPVT